MAFCWNQEVCWREIARWIYRHISMEAPGHHLKVEVSYVEIDAEGKVNADVASAHQFGNFISVYVSRPSPAGWHYISGYAIGYADDSFEAMSEVVNVN